MAAFISKTHARKNPAKRMLTILNDFSVPVLVKAIRENWADSYTNFGRSCSAELSDSPYLSWLLTGVPDAFLNVVFSTQLPLQGADNLIDETLALFRLRNVEKLSWWAVIGTQGEELKKHLISRGLVFDEGATGMAADLLELSETLPAITGLTVRPVEDNDSLRQWVHIMRAGFGIPENAEGRLFDLFADVVFEPTIQCFLAFLNDQPVGTSQFFLSAGVAGIYNVTCLHELRRQGIGAAVTLAALQEARRRGYRISILQASSMGYPVYRQLGFRDYGRLNIYTYKNEARQNPVDDRST